MKSSADKEEIRREYSTNWIKACLYRYLKGKTELEIVRKEIKSAKRYGVSKHNFQIIIESLPFDRKCKQFQDLIKILREVWE